MNKNIFTLFRVFFKIGLFTFGGGYAMISLIHNEIVDNHKFISDEDMLNLIVIAESTPGVLAVNTATFVGYRVGGVLGSAVATLGVIIPSVIIIGIISLFFDAFKNLKYVSYAFNGIKAGVIILIISAIQKLNKKNPKTAYTVSVMLISIILSLIFDVNAVYILISAVITGFIMEFIKKCFRIV